MAPTENNRYGVLLLNMGGPANLAEVEPYIARLLADPDMVRLPLGRMLQRPFAKLVSRRRAPKVRNRYAQIGGASPIGPTTARQASLLAQELDTPVGYAMRYTPPAAGKALGLLAQAGCSRYVVIPLYPQYSTVSTLSALKDLTAQSNGCELRVIDRHSANPEYIAAMRNLLADTLAQAAVGRSTHVLFAAHSIPEAYVRRGDPYSGEIEQTVAAIIAGLTEKPPYMLAYQSQVGPVKWRGPSLTEALAEIRAKGAEQLIVQPLSFVSENLETLYDLDIVFKEQCLAAGISRYLRVPALNDSPQYIAALANMVREEIRQWEAASA